MVPGPTLVLTRGQLSQITVVNEADVPTAVHWHGIELESYFDGVAGWSGAASRLAPIIAPADSFVARFVPPRAGTFIYHTHMDDMRQLAGGLYGPLVILEPGQRWNDTTDHAFVIGQAGLTRPAWIVVNGLPAPQAIRLKGGVAHRLRFLSMTLDDEADVFIERDKGAVMWRPLAKDGTPVPRAGGTSRPSRLHIGPGETYDFEVTLEPGDYRMRVMSYTNVLQLITVR
jgi:FtsP/CotA-like multicopper oxidase with cupredoxin domain